MSDDRRAVAALVLGLAVLAGVCIVIASRRDVPAPQGVFELGTVPA